MSNPTHAIIGLTCVKCKEKIVASALPAEEYRVLRRDGVEIHLSLKQAIIFRCAVTGNMHRDHVIFEAWTARGLEEPKSAANYIATNLMRLNEKLAALNLRLCRIKGNRYKYVFVDLKDTSFNHFDDTLNRVDISELLAV